MSHAALGYQMQVGCFYWRKKRVTNITLNQKMYCMVAFIEGFWLFVKHLFYKIT